MATILRGTKRELEELGRALRAGHLVGVPTETVYGLAADALNAAACRRIFKVKGRPADDPLIVHVGTPEEAERVAFVGAAARRLIARFWPGPLTIVLPKREVVPDVVTSGQNSVAVRMPAHPLMRRLLAAARRPLAAPSANPFGYVSPTTAEHVQLGLGRRIRYILDGGPAEIGVESTILDLRDEARPRVLRPGKIGRKELERVLRRRVGMVRRKARNDAGRAVLAPGMLARHYSPRTPVVLHRRVSAAEIRRTPADEAWVLVRVPPALQGQPNVFAWSEEGTPISVAKELFGRLRALDRAGWVRLHTVLVPGSDPLAEAVNDRLRRAAAT